jgi:hypothetical protein
MASIAPATADKLGKLLRLLASDRDGEALAAARSIVRVLHSDGLDIHALADVLTRPNDKQFSAEQAAEIYRQGCEDGRRVAEAAQPNGFHDINPEPSWHAVACECQMKPDKLKAHERDFVDDMVRWTVNSGEPTAKQAKWLRSIYVRVRR